MPSAPSPPPVADPGGVSAGQTASNLAMGESAQAGSQVNQITPTGGLTYYQTGVGPNGVPTYTAIQQLTPQQQMLLNLQQGGMGVAGGAGMNMLANSFGQYSTPPNLTDMAGGETQKLLGQETSYLSPYFKDQTTQLDTQLRNQGIMPGTPAYDQQMRQVQQNQNQAITGFLAQAEPQAFSQAQQQYLMPLQVGENLAGFNQPGNVNAPYTGQAPGYQPPNVIGAVANAQSAEEANYQAQMQQQTAMMNALVSGATGVAKMIPFSDRRVKRDVELVGFDLDLQVPLYRWRYGWDDELHVGPMAQDVELVHPEMVRDIGGVRVLTNG